MQTPYISPLKTLCYMYLGILVLVLNGFERVKCPTLGQQTADKSPRNPPPYPVLGVVGRDNDRRIICTFATSNSAVASRASNYAKQQNGG